jgi:hypothetical protein
MANWCIGGYWFILAPWRSKMNDIMVKKTQDKQQIEQPFVER